MSDFIVAVWPANSRQITQPFGVNPEFYAQFGAPGHTGIDIGGVDGVTDIFAVADGRVTMTRQQSHGFGNHVFVQHPNGYKTIYAHLHTISVSQGQALSAGAVVGKMGNTGASTGPHLHFELRGPRGQPGYPRNIIDPTPFLRVHLGFNRPTGPFKSGWVVEWGATLQNDLAQANAGGLSLRSGPTRNHERLNVVPEGTMMVVTGPAQGEYIPVDVPLAAIGEAAAQPVAKPAPEFPPMVSTVDGWGFATYVTPDDSEMRGIVGEYGINLRAAPRRDASNIGIVKGGSSISITGPRSGEYLPVRVARSDFIGEINMVETSPGTPEAGTLSGMGAVMATTCLGWGWTNYLEVRGEQAVVGQFGINLRASPSEFGSQIGIVKGLSVVTIAGKLRGEYTPVLVNKSDMVTIADPVPTIEQPEPLEEIPDPIDPEPTEVIPPQDSTPGWAFAGAVNISGGKASAGQFGINLRKEPHRQGENIGFVPAGAEMILAGAQRGEYVAVRVDDDILEPPFDPNRPSPVATSSGTAAASAGTTTSSAAPTPTATIDPPLAGQARLGLHASATPDIKDAEFTEFKALRPGIIKVLSFHSAEAIRRLAREHPEATWVVRAFLSMHNRDISPDQFLNDTLGDVKRALNELSGRDVVIELHNEPNLTLEGLGSSWLDGADFNRWWLQVLERYRQQLPDHRFIFPGLSPGPDQANLRQADRPFLEACRPAIDLADGLGMHAYWSNPNFGMLTHADSGTQLVDDYILRIRNKPIWITEASNNLGDDWNGKANEYIQFWREMQRRPAVQGITYFVASAAPGTFPHEIWVGNNIAGRLGAR